MDEQEQGHSRIRLHGNGAEAGAARKAEGNLARRGGKRKEKVLSYTADSKGPDLHLPHAAMDMRTEGGGKEWEGRPLAAADKEDAVGMPRCFVQHLQVGRHTLIPEGGPDGERLGPTCTG
jgi:hypothetical protein